MKNKVELLAPAGNYEAFLGAVNAGADAVYLGGERFGARAYADNFTTQEICRAIHVAHFMGRKIYLTVNTLLKDEEIEELDAYLQPFYEEGLDGVIVQDIGVLCYIRDRFPGLPLHASTQMTLTGPGGCAFLKEQGVERVVPARELSLQEIRQIKAQTGLEVECFIHGAMCYCYSGQCLFSSVLGGRSGNRGRCAQPCRLPYRIREGGTEFPDVEYPLSLKDMCTISYIPELIEAGIDSFKIEGRMKKAEYAAGVTALYRKYIDLYEREGKRGYKAAAADLEKLKSLYIRSEIQTGYYERRSSREMITLHKPSYAGNDDTVLAQIRETYLKEPDKADVRMKVCLEAEKPAILQITGDKADITVRGAVVEKAQKAPLGEADVRKRFSKTGNSCVAVSKCEIVMPQDVFLPVKSLNELRREGVEAYERQHILRQGMIAGRKYTENRPTKSVNRTEAVGCLFSELPSEKETGSAMSVGENNADIDILVSTYDQLTEAVQHLCRRIYIEGDLYLAQHEQTAGCMMSHRKPEYYIALPPVLRSSDSAYMEQITRYLSERDHLIKGFLVRNYEEMDYLQKLPASYAVIPDAGLYCFNTESIRFWAHYGREYTLPYELNRKEAGELVRRGEQLGMHASMIIYGRIPMMVTANCIRKTAGQCVGQKDPVRNMSLRDRYDVTFPVEINCMHCYNIIYNSVPYSLHLQERAVRKAGAAVRRYDFTTETAGECRAVLEGGEFPFESYTTGHLKRGVE